MCNFLSKNFNGKAPNPKKIKIARKVSLRKNKNKKIKEFTSKTAPPFFFNLIFFPGGMLAFNAFKLSFLTLFLRNYSFISHVLITPLFNNNMKKVLIEQNNCKKSTQKKKKKIVKKYQKVKRS